MYPRYLGLSRGGGGGGLRREDLLVDVLHVPPQIISVMEIRAADVAIVGFSLVAVDGRLMASQIEAILKVLLANLTVKEGDFVGAAFRVEISHVTLEIKVAVKVLVAETAVVRRRVPHFPADEIGARGDDDDGGSGGRGGGGVGGRRHVQHLASLNEFGDEVHFSGLVHAQRRLLKVGELNREMGE